MPNLFSMFRELVPSDPLLVGTVTASNGDVHQVTMMDGGVMMVRGKASLNQQVFVRGGVIEGAAPNLPQITIEV